MESAASTYTKDEFEKKSELLNEILASEKFKNNKLKNLKNKIKNLVKKIGNYKNIGLYEKINIIAFINIFLAQPEPEVLRITKPDSNLHAILVNFYNDNQNQISLNNELTINVESILECIKPLTHKPPRRAMILPSDDEGSDNYTSASSSYESNTFESNMRSQKENFLETVIEEPMQGNVGIKSLLLEPLGLIKDADEKAILNPNLEEAAVEKIEDTSKSNPITIKMVEEAYSVPSEPKALILDTVIDDKKEASSESTKKNELSIIEYPDLGTVDYPDTDLSKSDENKTDSDNDLDQLDSICTDDTALSEDNDSTNTVPEKINPEGIDSEPSIESNDANQNVINLDSEQTKKEKLKSAILRNEAIANYFKKLSDAEKQLVLNMHYQKEDKYDLDLSVYFAKEINTTIQQVATISKLLAKCDEAQIHLRDQVKHDHELKQVIGKIEQATKQLINNSDDKVNKDQAFAVGHQSIKNIMQDTIEVNSQKNKKIRLAAQKYLIFHEAKEKLSNETYYLNPAERINQFKNTLLSDANRQILSKQRDPIIVQVMHTVGYLLGCAISFTVGFWTYLAMTRTPLPVNKTESARIADSCERAIKSIKP